MSGLKRSSRVPKAVSSAIRWVAILAAILLCAGIELAAAPGSTRPVPRLAATQDVRVPNAGRLYSSRREFTIIDDGDVRDAVLVEGLDPDIYVAHPATRSRRVSVVTDRGRLDFDVAPGSTFDFGIVWRGRVYPQRVTDVPVHAPVYRGNAARSGGVDIIPFRLGPNNGLHVQAAINASGPLDLIFDTGASLGVVAEGGTEKGAVIAGGRANTLRVGSVTISGLPLTAIDYGGNLRSDGVIGYDAFAGKIVEIDYTSRVLRIHHSRPDVTGYRRERLVWRGSRTMTPLTVETPSGPRSVLAIFDTGSRWSLSLGYNDPAVAALQGLGSMGSRTGVRSDGRRVRSRVVSAPRVSLAGIAVDNVQVELEQATGESGLPYNITGNDFLKRFDVIIDYRSSEIFVRPSPLRNAPWNSVFPDWLWWAIAGFLAAASLALLMLVLRWRARRWQARPAQA